MAELGSATLELNTRDTGLRKGIDRARGMAERLDRRFQEVGQTLNRVGREFTLFATGPIVGLSAVVAKLAIDAEETANKFNVVFRGSVEEANEAISDLTETIPLTTSQMQGLGAGIQDMLVPMGLARDEAAELSVEAIQLAGDLASFNNVLPTEALNALRSALAGESEPLRRFGVDTRVTRLETLALNKGIIEQGEELNNTTRALAVFAAVQEDSADAIGDAARTVGSAANQLRFLKRDIRLIGEQIGEVFIPIIRAVVPEVREWLSGFTDLTARQRVLIVGIGALVAAIGPLLIAFGSMIRLVGFALGAFAPLITVVATLAKVLSFLAVGVFTKAVIPALKGGVVAIKGVGRALLLMLSPVGIVIAGIASLVAGIVIFSRTIGNVGSAIVQKLKAALVAPFVNEVLRPMQMRINELIRQFNRLAPENLEIGLIDVTAELSTDPGQDLSEIFSDAVDSAKVDLENFKSAAGQTFDSIKKTISDKFGGALDTVKEKGGDALDFIGDKATGLIPSFDGMNAAIDDIINSVEATDFENKFKLPPLFFEQTGEAKKEIEEVKDKGKDAENAFARMGFTLSSAFEDAIFQARSFGDILGGLLKDIAKIILRKQVLDPLAGAIGGLFGGGSGGQGGIASIGQGLFGRQHGGRVQAGQTVEVNEGNNQREFFQPDSAGRIFPSIPQGKGEVSLTINAPGADEGTLNRMREIARSEIIPQAIQGSMQAFSEQARRPRFA